MNYSTLQTNILASLESEEAKLAFLRAQEQPSDDPLSYRAESFAREVDKLVSLLRPGIALAAKPFEVNNDVRSDLLDFTLKRHWHNAFARSGA